MKHILKTIIIYLYLLILELIYNLATINNFFNINLIYKLIFSLGFAILINIIISLFSPKINKIITNILFIVLTLYFYGQFIFYKLFSIPFAFSSLSLANQALDFKNIIFSTLKNNLIETIFFLIPLIIILIYFNLSKLEKIKLKEFGIALLCYFIIMFIGIGLLNIHKNETYSPYNLYFNINNPNITIQKFGLLTETNLDINRLLFDFKNKVMEEKEVFKETKESYNKIDIDFNKLINNETDAEIKSMHEYFQNSAPTNQNKYTGLYQDKNLIVILAEGFNRIAVSKELTPTLYKMVNSSFVFHNFYSPMFLSTTGGEFQVTTGLVPSQNTLKLWKTKTPNILNSYGHVFNKLGYKTYAYHDWTYTYYDRDKTMPTLGFNNFLGCKNGLETKMNCQVWPPSDIEMIKATIDDYIKEDKFMSFYITVSGHAEYNWYGNKMALKNKDKVQNLDYSEPVKAYLATQIELDQALEVLLKRLEQENILDDTVIALVGDHYPYTLAIEEINELEKEKVDSTFEVAHSNFILYNSQTKKEEVDKIAGNLDVLPTILNLFGIEYDSRLLMGKDIFSDSEGLVILSDGSWITKKGRYNASLNKFIASDEVSSDYVEKINTLVQNKISLSNLLIKHNYYTIIEESR